MRQSAPSVSRRAFLAASLAAAAIGPARAEEALRFGMAMPLSGGQATYGQDQVKAAEWAVAAINERGGVAGRKLEMIVLDTRADPQAGIQAANRLISVDKVPVFVSAWSAVVKAVAPVANDSRTVQLSVGANSAEIARLGDYTYTTFPLASVDITAVATYAAKQMGKKRAAVLYINNETGTVAAQIYRDVFAKSGGQVVAYEAYDPRASDWTGPLLKVRAAQPDIVHIQGLVADTPQVIAQMRQLGLTLPVSSYSAVYNPKLIEQLGKAAEGVIATSLAPGVTDSPAVAAYVERWKKEVGREPNGLPYTQYLYDAPYIVAEVYRSLIEKKIPLSGENFRKEMLAIRSFDLPLTGKLVINDDHTVNKPVFLMEVKGGRWVQKAVVE
ncbi:ABC transporter substrate-binding protein [Methylobacterium nodulans]|uniref:Extracellular ligand-binding receptor n=1 Tax=Methylobacterium nodulans (strain LMG 21967 / CNCM I-2342 / ORS 2060) TaxID=460265 RepID=B8IWR5_METNO|nr:ABC transporter substrate-binding protein [Methylobacterium nodulans]ACL62956.1 Extracellular ligand-binding receptor [Methylobacterium nodulans ORS 2060]